MWGIIVFVFLAQDDYDELYNDVLTTISTTIKPAHVLQDLSSEVAPLAALSNTKFSAVLDALKFAFTPIGREDVFQRVRAIYRAKAADDTEELLAVLNIAGGYDGDTDASL